MAQYGTVEYYKKEVECAKLKMALFQEAITMRLKDDKIKSSEISLYLQVLQEIENSVDYNKKQYEAAVEKGTEKTTE